MTPRKRKTVGPASPETTPMASPKCDDASITERTPTSSVAQNVGRGGEAVPRLRILGLNATDTRQEPPPPPASWTSTPQRYSDDTTDGYFGRRTRLLDFLLGLILAVSAVIAVVTTYRGFGHSWDEALYLRPAAAAGSWVWDLLRGDKTLLQEGAIAHAWGLGATGDDPLHPEVAPIPKAVIGLAMTALAGYGVPEMQAMRLPIAVAFGLTVALLYILGARTFGRLGGFAGAVAYMVMPRVFGHAHIAASETLFALTVVLLVWAYLAGIRRPAMGVLSAITFALAINTKVTALLLPLPLFLWGQIYYRRDYATNVFFMLFLAPLVAWLLWPWLWYDPLGRFSEYVRFYARHQSTAVFYMGQLWGYIHGPPAPWHYPLVITALGTPPWVLTLAIVGIARSLVQARSHSVPVLFSLMTATFIGVCSLPNAPKYDGERLFFAAFAFLALLAGGGYSWLVAGIDRWNQRRVARVHWVTPVAIFAVFVLGGWGVATLRWIHPNELNYFNVFIGGPRGAYERGFETSYWGEALNEEVIAYLNSLANPGTKFKPLALNELAFQNLQGWGILSDEASFAAGNEPFDYYILQVRQGFFGRLERALHYGAEPLRTFSTQNVPRIQVFAGDALTKPKKPLDVPTPVGKEQTHDIITTKPLSNNFETTGSVIVAETSGTNDHPNVPFEQSAPESRAQIQSAGNEANLTTKTLDTMTTEPAT